jgi:hypothetical protein
MILISLQRAIRCWLGRRLPPLIKSAWGIIVQAGSHFKIENQRSRSPEQQFTPPNIPLPAFILPDKR